MMMKRLLALPALFVAVIVSPPAVGEDFTPTAKTDMLVRWLDIDSISGSADEKSAFEYFIFGKDQSTRLDNGSTITYAAMVTRVTFHCSTEHFESNDLHLYSGTGDLVHAFEGPVIAATIISPQTPESSEFEIVCHNKSVESFKGKDIPPNQTPMQFLIGGSRKILSGG